MKKKSLPFPIRLYLHQPTNQVVIDIPFDSIDQRQFRDLPHLNCNCDEGCVADQKNRIKRCGIYLKRLFPGQPRRYPIKYIELKPTQGRRKTLVTWCGGADSLDDLEAILGLLGLSGKVVGKVKHTQVEMYVNIHHDDVVRACDGTRQLFISPWGLHVLQETTPGTLHKVKAAQTYLEGRFVRTEITRVVPKKQAVVKVWVYDIPETVEHGYRVKIEAIAEAPDGNPFTGKERAKLEKIIAGFLTVLCLALEIQTWGFAGRQNGQAYRLDRNSGSQYGKRIIEAYWYAVQLGMHDGLSPQDAVVRYFDTALSLLACKPMTMPNESRHKAMHGQPEWVRDNSCSARIPVSEKVAEVMEILGGIELWFPDFDAA